MSVVLDASAVLAYLRDEPGASTVGEAIAAWVDDRAAAPLVSTVSSDRDRPTRPVLGDLGELPVLTADREWSRAGLDLEIRQIR